MGDLNTGSLPSELKKKQLTLQRTGTFLVLHMKWLEDADPQTGKLINTVYRKTVRMAPKPGAIFKDSQNRAYEVQPNGSIRRV